MSEQRVASGPGRPRLVLLAALAIIVAWLAVGSVGGPATGRLSEVQKNDNASFLPADAESTSVLESVARFSDEEEVPLIVVVERSDGEELDLRAGAALLKLAEDLPSLPLGESGETLGDYVVDGARIGPVPSEDRKAALIVIPLKEAAVSAVVDGEAPVVAAADAVRTKARIDLAATGLGLTSSVGGPGGLIADFSAAFAGIDGVLLLVALCVVLVILLVVYRSPVLPLAVLMSAVFGLCLAVLVIRPLAENGTIELSGQSQGIMFILVVGAATDYALLLVSRFREELHEHESTWVALKRAWRGAVEPIVASGATVILGLLCLLLADLRNTSGLGPVGALGIAGALLASLTFLPAVLLVFGRKAFWPFAPRVDHHHAEDAVGTRSLWGRVSGLVGRHPRRTWVAALVVLLAAAAFAPSFKAEGVTIKDTFLTATDSVDAQEAIQRHFAAGSGSPVQVIVPAEQAEAARTVVEADSGIESAWVGLTPPVPGQPTPTAEPVDGLQLVQGTTTGAADSQEAEDTVRRLRASLDPVSRDAVVGGQAAINLDVLDASGRDLRVIVPAILVVIFLVLCLLLRSILAPLLLVVANVISFAATIGVAQLVFDHILGFGGSDPAIPLYGFVFLVALGIDYSIFLMTRVREESVRRGTRPGILVGLAVTGGVITSAGIVLAATFSALTVLPLVFLVQVAFIVAFGVLLDTFVVRSLLVPALSYDIGPKVWWPARLAGDRRAAPGAAPDERRTSEPSGV
ncbi:MMPL family transporter [Knoellia subterranea]|uniref:Membrane protein n=1 Tax=Knoellia subterranea KCTC 19937 TaxID=1385521 RepID=A0A0A0JQW6_9MICO|nr:MMPL family transporter [Knoellia subterranea]KGN38432.1 membrane protein [Knoellia subterranea KCTC 19937]